MNDQVTLTLCGGGTGGHVMPSLAVGEEFLRQVPGGRLCYIGNKDSLEERLARELSIEFFPVSIKPLRRGRIFENLSVPFLAVSSIVRAGKILLANRTTLVFGSGGFSSWPAAAAARMNGVPYFLTDGNAYPGLVTRLLGSGARKVFITFEATKAHFKGDKTRLLLTGFPVSPGVGSMDVREARRSLGLDPERRTLLVTGGSGGARSINQTVSRVREAVLARGLNLIWQTGKFWNVEEIESGTHTGRLVVEQFLDPPRMRAAISAANLAISRCGIMTLSEFAVAGLPAILVPFPFSAEGHQEENARSVEKAGGGVMILDKDLTSDHIIEQIDLCLDPVRLESMSAGMRSLAHPDAAHQIVRIMLESLNA